MLECAAQSRHTVRRILVLKLQDSEEVIRPAASELFFPM